MKFTVYGTPSCIWCERAKQLIEFYHCEFKYIDLHEDLEAQKMFKENKFRTVPQVFLDNTLIGGYEDLKHFLQSPAPDHI